MKIVAILTIIIIAFTSCFNSPQNTISHRWNFAGVDMPGVRGFIDSISSTGQEAKDAMEEFFRGNELILRKDNTFDIAVFKHYVHGIWKYDETNKRLTLTDDAGLLQPIVWNVENFNNLALQIQIDANNLQKLIPSFQYSTTGYSYLLKNNVFTFFLSRNGDIYWQDKNDPYSKVNNLWRIKPNAPETDAQILERVNRHLKFCKLVIKDAMDKGYLSFNWFVTPLIINVHGAGLRGYDDARQEWESNFYDSTQAEKGYKLLRQSVLNSHYKPDETKLNFENYVGVIDGLIENLGK